LDSDHDGLPDWWELIRGTNPHSAPGDFSDANADLVGDGYTELERYLNWLAQPHYNCNTGAVLSVDLTQYTRGFRPGSTYAVFAATNGTVGLTGGAAQFSPTIGTNGLGAFTFTVADGTNFSYTNSINVHIIAASANTAPVLAPISNRTINVGYNLSITNMATDSDTPAQTLTYTLPTAPTNATIGSSNGVISWRPLVTQANTTNPFSVVVTDNGTPPMSATQSFNVVVNPLMLPSITMPVLSNGQVGLSVSGQTGPDYGIENSTNLSDWQMLLITNPSAMPFIWQTTNFSSPMQFYRIKVGPPLP
jgi:hypothetical protein